MLLQCEGLQTETQEALMFQFESEIRSKPMSQFKGRILCYLGQCQPFVLFRSLTDWMRSTNIREYSAFLGILIKH